MVSKVRGQFTDFTGTVTVGEDLASSLAEVTVTMSSIDTRNADRDTHLRSGDFFDVENHPEMTFRSTAFDGETLTGDLTIKGVTKPVTLDVEFNGLATDPWGNTKAGFEADRRRSTARTGAWSGTSRSRAAASSSARRSTSSSTSSSSSRPDRRTPPATRPRAGARHLQVPGPCSSRAAPPVHSSRLSRPIHDTPT